MPDVTLIRATSVSTNPNMEVEGWEANHYKVTLGYGRRRFTVFFSMGSAHTTPPTAQDVLDCCLSDAASVENARSFEDWCAELGYDTDSRKAERTYRVCERYTKRLRVFLGDDYEAMAFPTVED